MKPIKKCSGCILVTMCVLAVVFISRFSFAENASPPHTFKAGVVISADMLNENFEDIATNQKFLSPSDFLGTWECNAVSIKNSLPMGVGLTECGWSIDSEDFCYSKNFTITFNNNGEGTYTYTANNQIFGDCSYSPDVENTLPYRIIGDSMFVKKVTDMAAIITVGWYGGLKITNKSKTSFIAFISQTNTYWYCTKQNLQPAKPTNLSASTSGLIVTLSWVDNSNDETGFKIIRKDSLSAAYENIATTGANITSHPGTVPTAGTYTYWYRVQATNSNGDSLGSNVVKVTVTE